MLATFGIIALVKCTCNPITSTYNGTGFSGTLSGGYDAFLSKINHNPFDSNIDVTDTVVNFGIDRVDLNLPKNKNLSDEINFEMLKPDSNIEKNIQNPFDYDNKFAVCEGCSDLFQDSYLLDEIDSGMLESDGNVETATDIPDKYRPEVLRRVFSPNSELFLSEIKNIINQNFTAVNYVDSKKDTNSSQLDHSLELIDSGMLKSDINIGTDKETPDNYSPKDITSGKVNNFASDKNSSSELLDDILNFTVSPKTPDNYSPKDNTSGKVNNSASDKNYNSELLDDILDCFNNIEKHKKYGPKDTTSDHQVNNSAYDKNLISEFSAACADCLNYENQTIDNEYDSILLNNTASQQTTGGNRFQCSNANKQAANLIQGDYATTSFLIPLPDSPVNNNSNKRKINLDEDEDEDAVINFNKVARESTMLNNQYFGNTGSQDKSQLFNCNNKTVHERMLEQPKKYSFRHTNKILIQRKLPSINQTILHRYDYKLLMIEMDNKYFTNGFHKNLVDLNTVSDKTLELCSAWKERPEPIPATDNNIEYQDNLVNLANNVSNAIEQFKNILKKKNQLFIMIVIRKN